MSHDQGHHSRDWQNNPPSSQSQFSQGGPLLHESTEPIRLPKISRAPPRRTDHTYRDFSNYPVDHLPKILQSPTNFPSKLHHILSDPECHHIISWMPHGRAWKIHKKELLISEVVPKFFTHSKFESFTRQLNGWGFKRLHQAGNDFNAYYHECFLRGLPQLTALMKRAAPNQGRLLPHLEGEPNFYEIDRHFKIPPLGMHHGQGRNPSTTNAGDNVFAPHHYPPPPPPPHPFYGNPSDPHAMANYPIYSGQPSYSPYHIMPYGPPPPPEHYTYFSHPFNPRHGAEARNDDVPPSATDHDWNEEESSDHVPPQHPMGYDHMQPQQHPHFYNHLVPQYGEQPQTTPAPQDAGAVQTKSPDDDEPKEYL